MAEPFFSCVLGGFFFARFINRPISLGKLNDSVPAVYVFPYSATSTELIVPLFLGRLFLLPLEVGTSVYSPGFCVMEELAPPLSRFWTPS